MKKRTLALICALILVLTTALPLTALANMQYRYVYTSNGKSLNQRSAPITHANNRVANIPYGAKVAVDSYVNGNTWAYVEYNGKWGYVMSRYLVKNQPAAKAASSTSTSSQKASFNGFVEVTYSATVRSSAPGGFVNLRWAPSKSEAIEAKLADGQKLTIIAQNETWAQVRVESSGAVGFIMRAFLNDTGADS
ncbi:MAG: SH3 domain-containing protein [Eubacteriales bacterium]|nr:SH3 domain-containing protein [Eubacteriales bacterium]